MKHLVLSDIHGNLDALEAVLLKLKAQSVEFDKCVVLGDLVGYGANPNEVTEKIRKMESAEVIRGNHDRVAAGLSDGSGFNRVARNAALWTREQFTQENREYIAKLPRGPVEIDELFHLVHGSPWDEDYYIFNWKDALVAFQRSDRRFVLFGHTHVPVIWTLDGDKLNGEAIADDHYELSFEKNARYLINPGSVGQPRDGDPKSSLVVLDTDKMNVQFFRIEYDIKSAQKKIREAGLDSFLAKRLAAGM